MANWNGVYEGDEITITFTNDIQIYFTNETGYGQPVNSDSKEFLKKSTLTGTVHSITNKLLKLKASGSRVYTFPNDQQENFTINIINKNTRTNHKRMTEEETDLFYKNAARKLRLDNPPKPKKTTTESSSVWTGVSKDEKVTIKNISNKNVKINTQNTGNYSGQISSATIQNNDKLTGSVQSIDERLVLNTGMEGDGERLYYFPSDQQKNFTITKNTGRGKKTKTRRNTKRRPKRRSTKKRSTKRKSTKKKR